MTIDEEDLNRIIHYLKCAEIFGCDKNDEIDYLIDMLTEGYADDCEDDEDCKIYVEKLKSDLEFNISKCMESLSAMIRNVCIYELEKEKPVEWKMDKFN